jgi:hypothetical protein
MTHTSQQLSSNYNSKYSIIFNYRVLDGPGYTGVQGNGSATQESCSA